jgi:hypothetical protein
MESLLKGSSFFCAPRWYAQGVTDMEDWQQWQVQADAAAVQLNAEVQSLESEYFSESSEGAFRGFWPRFRDLKERVRIAPAIRLEDKLDLERKLRTLGSRAYKAQEGTYARSGERKAELLGSIGEYRQRAETLGSPRDLRNLRRELDHVRESFDSGPALVPADRQQVWDAWKEASQFVWTRLTGAWGENEIHLRGLLDTAREQLEAGKNSEARGTVRTFFESLRGREARQESLNALKTEAEDIRRQAEEIEERKASQRTASQQARTVPALDTWRAELTRSREAEARLEEEVAVLEKQFRESTSLLDQAMVRGTLVDKKRRLTEHQRASRTLEQRIEAAEETPVMSAG